VQKRLESGIISGHAAVAGGPLGVLPMKNRLRYREQARWVYYDSVFETKTEISASRVLWQVRRLHPC
jgi:hypothetical protein